MKDCPDCHSRENDRRRDTDYGAFLLLGCFVGWLVASIFGVDHDALFWLVMTSGAIGGVLCHYIRSEGQKRLSKKACDDLTAESEKLGLYDKPKGDKNVP